MDTTALVWIIVGVIILLVIVGLILYWLNRRSGNGWSNSVLLIDKVPRTCVRMRRKSSWTHARTKHRRRAPRPTQRRPKSTRSGSAGSQRSMSRMRTNFATIRLSRLGAPTKIDPLDDDDRPSGSVDEARPGRRALGQS